MLICVLNQRVLSTSFLVQETMTRPLSLSIKQPKLEGRVSLLSTQTVIRISRIEKKARDYLVHYTVKDGLTEETNPYCLMKNRLFLTES